MLKRCLFLTVLICLVVVFPCKAHSKTGEWIKTTNSGIKGNEITFFGKGEDGNEDWGSIIIISFYYLDDETIEKTYKDFSEEVKKILKDKTVFLVTVQSSGRAITFYPTGISIVGPSYESGEMVQYNIGHSDFVKTKGEFFGKIIPGVLHTGLIMFPRLRENGEWKIYYEGFKSVGGKDKYIILRFNNK